MSTASVGVVDDGGRWLGSARGRLEVDEPQARVVAAHQRDGAAAGHLLDAEGAHQLDEVVDLLRRAGDLDDHRLRGDVDDPAAEDLEDVEQVAAGGVGRVHAQQQQLVGDDALAGDVVDGDDVDELGELLGGLLGLLPAHVHGDGHARHRGVVGGPDRQRVDVEAAPAHHRGDAVEHARLVLDEDGEQAALAHDASTKSSMPLPSGTIG